MTRFCRSQDYRDIEAVRDAYPGAYKIIPVEEGDGGWRVFDYVPDYETWMAQV